MKRKNKTFSVILLFGILVLLNIIGSQINCQIDLTENNLYTLSDGTKNLISKIQEPINLKFYFSRSVEDTEVTTRRKNYANIVEELLKQYVSASDGMINLEIIEPKPDTEEEEDALRAGILGNELPNGEKFFFGLHLIQADKEHSIPFFLIEREKFLEYDLSQIIYQTQIFELPKLGVITSLEMFGTPLSYSHMAGTEPVPAWIVIQELRQFYDVQQITTPYVHPDIDILLVIHPQHLSKTTQYSIDQFLLSGKPVIIAVDPSSNIQRWSAAFKRRPDIPTSSDLPDLFKGWGIIYDPEMVVGDLDYAASVSMKNHPDPVPFPIWLEITDFNTATPATNMLETLRIAEAGSFKFNMDADVTFTPFISTSENNSEMMASIIPTSTPKQIQTQILGDNISRTIAGIISGSFNTAFPDGEPIVSKNKDSAWIEKLNKQDKPHLSESVEKSSLVIFTDTDFLGDRFAVGYSDFSGNSTPVPINDNLALIYNIIEYTSGSKDLISLRSKGSSVRPFDVVTKLNNEARNAFHGKQMELQSELNKVEAELRVLQQEQMQRKNLNLSSEVNNAVRKFNKKKANLLRDLREIRKKRRENVENLSMNLALLNLLVIPILIAISGIKFFVKRDKRTK